MLLGFLLGIMVSSYGFVKSEESVVTWQVMKMLTMEQIVVIAMDAISDVKLEPLSEVPVQELIFRDSNHNWNNK